MSWEALRLTSRTPSELYHVLGPHGVDELLRQAISTCWRELPAETRSFDAGRRAVTEVYDRNIQVWRAIKKPEPAAFFANLLPHAADGFMRQAIVLCWMMMPRGKRSLTAVDQVMTSLFQRNMDAWEQDNQTFTRGPAAKTAARTQRAKQPAKRTAKATGRKTAARKKAASPKKRRR